MQKVGWFQLLAFCKTTTELTRGSELNFHYMYFCLLFFHRTAALLNRWKQTNKKS